MSLRRKSCNACFQGRRKCDLAFPTCQRCAKTGKSCSYVREPPSVATQYSSSSTAPSTDILTDTNESTDVDALSLGSYGPLQDLDKEFSLDPTLQDISFDFTAQILPSFAPNLLGELGDLQPLPGNAESWQWVAGRLRECPGKFARTGENIFIHRSMYSVQSYSAINAAFGICAASQIVTPATGVLFTSSLETEVSKLTSDIAVNSVPERLARLQAMVLYQILRTYSGDSQQQSAAEQQKSALNVCALRLLQQMQTEVPHPRTVEELTLVESVRRTVMTTYILHALGSVFKYGVCTELPTLALLPVSVDSEAWEPSDSFSARGDAGTMKYGEWTEMWATSPLRPKLNEFQKMLMVACKGKAKVEELEAEIS